jgi:hypothetical protein
LFVFGYALFQYFAASSLAIAMSGAHQIQKSDNPRLWRVVENLAISQGMPMPKVYIINDPAPNAFATGRDPKNAVVAATTGLMDIMNDRELEGVMAHVAAGMSLSRSLDRSGLFPPLLLDMVNVGEQTGDMSAALAKAAERFDRDLSKKIEKLTALAQPAIVFLMAGLVGTMAYLMMTAIFQTIGNISK